MKDDGPTIPGDWSLSEDGMFSRLEPRALGEGALPFVKGDVPAQAPYVRTSDERVQVWDLQRIVECLVREARLDFATAEAVARDVQETILRADIEVLTTPLVRELVNAALIARGLEGARRLHARLGAPVFNVRRALLKGGDRGAAALSAAATDAVLARQVKKEFALLEVFGSQVVDAHLRGDIHLHDVDAVDRLAAVAVSPEQVKCGIWLPESRYSARPPDTAEEAVTQLVQLHQALGQAAAAQVVWPVANAYLAPLLHGAGRKRTAAVGAALVTGLAATGVPAWLGVAVSIPSYLERVAALGPGGKTTGRPYAYYQREALALADAMLDAWACGDGEGRSLHSVEPMVTVQASDFENALCREVVSHFCHLAKGRGGVRFAFEREAVPVLPEVVRPGGSQGGGDAVAGRISLNLPRAAYAAGGNTGRLFANLAHLTRLCLEAAAQRKLLLAQIAQAGERGPMALLTHLARTQPGLAPDQAAYHVGIVGLEETVRSHTGRALHECSESMALARKILERLTAGCAALGEEFGVTLLLDGSPCQGVGERFARLDLLYWRERAERVIDGCGDEPRYRGAIQPNAETGTSPLQRLSDAGRLSGALHIPPFLACQARDMSVELFEGVFYGTEVAGLWVPAQVVECAGCGWALEPTAAACSHCGATAIVEIAR